MALQRVLFMLDGFGIGPNTFTRSGTVGPYTDSDSLLKSAAANVYRREWLWLDTWALGNLPDTPALLLEAAATNLVTSDDLTAWTQSGTPVITGGKTDPAGGTGAYTVEDNNGAAEEYITRSIALTDGTRTAVFVVRQKTMPASGVQSLTIIGAAIRLELNISAWVSGAPTVAASVGTYLGKRYIGNGYWALYGLTTTVVGADSNVVRIHPAATAAQTGSIDVYRVNAYNSASPGWSILDASETRNVDTWYAAFAHVPQAMTVYVKFIEGMATTWSGNEGVLHIGTAGMTGPLLHWYRASGTDLYYFKHTNGTSVEVSVDINPTWGQTVELRGVLNADGSIVAAGRLNGGTEVVSSATAALALANAWGDTRLYFNGRGTIDAGLAAFISVKLVAGVKSMAEMVSLDPACVLNGLAIPVAEGSVRQNRFEIGDRDRTFDGTLRETIRSRVSIWDAETTPLSIADMNEVVAKLESSTQPHQAFGDMFKLKTGVLPNVFSRLNESRLVQSGNERKYALSFTAEQSS